MSYSFSFSRLGRLIKKQFIENARFYTFSALALFALLAVVFCFYLGTGGPQYSEVGTWLIFIFGLFISGSVFASMSFNMLHSKDKGIYWLGLPATHLEKLICTIFFSTILFSLVYSICFFSLKEIAILYIKGLTKDNPQVTFEYLTDYSHGFGNILPNFIYTFFAMQAFYLLGSVYFSRYTFVVTTVVGAAIIFVFAYYITNIQNNFLEHNSWDFITLRKDDIGVKDKYYLYSVSPAIQSIVKYLVQFAWAPIFWVISWYRLKEKEV